jgi:hypothetical protein
MKGRPLELRPFSGNSLLDVLGYLRRDLARSLSDLFAILATPNSATPDNAGDVDTEAQTFGGVKTFQDGITFDNTDQTQTVLASFYEGSFTPRIEGSVSSGSGTYQAQQGRYTLINETVFFSMYIAWTLHDGTGDIRVVDLPFTAPSEAYYSVSVYADNIDSTTSAGMVGLVTPGSAKITVYGLRDNDTPVAVPMLGNDDAASHVLIVSGWYRK